ncbi:MAG TPA: hypothetical protein ENH41_02120 [Candidatus Omnitrophica bacterium]|nr:hypothetical protein [Candidatus Omnitrophota bacterium]
MKNEKYPSMRGKGLPSRKGEKLKISRILRPTEARVRSAIFDILGDISGLSFLDLFAGSGSVGIEAISCRVKKAVFVEKNRKALNLIKDGLSGISISVSVNIVGLDVFKAIPRLYMDHELFDIVFLDPPYYAESRSFSKPVSGASRIKKGNNSVRGEDVSLAKKTLQTINVYDILTPSGLILVQHYKKDILSEGLDNFTLYRQYKYGDTCLSLYKR